jgi:hypothetical protein
MENLTHYPALVFIVAFVSLSLASMVGVWLRSRYPNITDEHKDDLNVILAATLTLLALIIGFSFSMATNRTISVRISRKRKPTQSALNCCELTFCNPQKLQTCASSLKNTWISASCSITIWEMRNVPGR